MHQTNSAPIRPTASARAETGTLGRLRRAVMAPLAVAVLTLSLLAASAPVPGLPPSAARAAGAQASRAGAAPVHPLTGTGASLLRLGEAAAAPLAITSRRPAPPATASSRYITKAKPSVLRRLGCEEGSRLGERRSLSDSVVILAFGRPVRRRGIYGASIFGRGMLSTAGVERMARAYVRGYEACVTPDLPSRLTLALGTSNYGHQVTYGHGRAWARMVNGVNDWLRSGGHWRVQAVGATDIELGWNGPKVSRLWVKGYDSAATWPFYNFGDAGACPPAGNCAGAWTQEDVWWVSWGARSAWPLPQIYTPTGTMSEQWYRLSLYSLHRHGSRMHILGVISQRQACRDSTDPCRGMNIAPKTAWRQLHRALNRDPRTAQSLRWSTDFGWSR